MDQSYNARDQDKGSRRVTRCMEQPSGFSGCQPMCPSTVRPTCCTQSYSFPYPHWPSFPHHFPPLPPYFRYSATCFQQYPPYHESFAAPTNFHAGHSSCVQANASFPVAHVPTAAAPNSLGTARSNVKNDPAAAASKLPEE
ncbi:hypothetical protein RvY_03040-2 [Ramazzottius varieornatus]|uniref:Uncharacterized protein n=1 Tax=Ramazzottius varieornatus TaxID=947166 RepID=A0A1D1USF4_RAMVA|nr:hypothetical protein RvY_03040-2 [Ramazzottius varieornatus]